MALLHRWTGIVTKSARRCYSFDIFTFPNQAHVTKCTVLRVVLCKVGGLCVKCNRLSILGMLIREECAGSLALCKLFTMYSELY